MLVATVQRRCIAAALHHSHDSSARFYRGQTPLGCSRNLQAAVPLPLSPVSWNATENWCSLCKEPHNSWPDHTGKRDHVCLELFYNAMAREPRHWNAQKVLYDYWDTWHRHLRLRGGTSDGCVDIYASQYRMADNNGSINSMVDAHGQFLKYFDKAWEVRRRTELLAMLLFLRRRGLLRFGSELKSADRGGMRATNSTAPLSDPSSDAEASPNASLLPRGSDLQSFVQWNGALVMFKEFHKPMLRLFPHSDQKHLSGLTQMAASNYNLETVFELCQLEQLLTAKVMGVTHLDELTYNTKGNVVRDILGQLRFSIEEESVPIPAMLKEVAPYLVVICQLAARMLICEIVFCRLSEYVCRVEGVWHAQGMPCLNAVDFSTQLQSPPAPSSGMVSLISSTFHDANFGANLNQDPRNPRRRSVQFFYDYKVPRAK